MFGHGRGAPTPLPSGQLCETISSQLVKTTPELRMAADELLNGDLGYPSRLQEEEAEKRRAAKGKARAEPNKAAAGDAVEAAVDEEASARQLKSIEENLRRWNELERNRRASKRRNAPAVAIQPPLADLSRAGSLLMRRASKRTSSESRKSSVDSNGTYSTISRPTSSRHGSLAGLAEVAEESPIQRDSDGFEEQPTSPPLGEPPDTPAELAAKRTGSKFVEDLEPTSPAGLPRFGAQRRHDSTFSLRTMTNRDSVASVVMGSGGLYSQPLAQDSTTLLTREDEMPLQFGAGYRTRTIAVPWYEAVFCCACWGGEDEDVQAGATCEWTV